VFGPRRFEAGADRTTLSVEQFNVASPTGAYVLRVVPEPVGPREVRAQVRLNGSIVVGAAALAGGRSVTLPVNLMARNTLEVWAKGGEGSGVRVAVLQLPEPRFDLFGPRVFSRDSGGPAVQTATFALPAGAAPPYRLHVQNGDPDGSARVAKADLDLNGADPLGSPGLTPQVGALLRDVALTSANTLRVRLRGPSGSRITLRVSARDTAAPRIEIATPAPGLVTRAAQVEVAGTVRDMTATRVTVNGVEAARTGEAFRATVPLAEGNNALTITAVDAAGNRADSVRAVIRDTQPPVVTFTAPAEGLVTRADSLTVTGTLQDVTAVEANLNGVPVPVGAAGAFSVRVPLAEGVNFLALTATDRAGNSASRVRQVVRDTQPPVLAVAAPTDGATTAADSIRVAGRVHDATAVRLTVNGAVTSVAADSTFSTLIALAVGTSPVTVVATDAAGNTASVVRTVTRDEGTTLPPDPETVAPPLNPTTAAPVSEATEFLYTGTNPVQTGVAPGTIEPVRATVVRGRVVGRDGAPLPGVTVTVMDHPELGQTLSRADGWYDLVVNGGGLLTVAYRRDGFLPADRKVQTQWQEFVTADDVALVALDAAVTPVEFGAGADAPQVARAAVASDADGDRQATLVFDPGTEALLEMPDGTTRPASTLSIRATEYTVGENGRAAMPAELPPTSGYTYAVELSADEAIAAGAPHVRFSKPVAFYVDNFLGFPVGTPVPAGWYDRERAAWVPTDDGRVIGIVSVSGGVAGVDTDGDGAADPASTLDALGIDAAERGRLAATYAPGKTLWRVETTHFSWIDLNYPRGSPDAQDPRQDQADPGTPEDDPCQSAGSIIECENQTLGERVALAGTAFTLNYRSDRVPGRAVGRTLEIPVSGASLPASVRRIVVEVEVAGRVFADTLPAAPNQRWSFAWDGKDAYGRTLRGRHPARVSVGWVFPQYYLAPASSARSFGLTCTPAQDGDYWQQCVIPQSVNSSARQEDVRWQRYTVQLAASGDWDARAQALGGWTLDVHHAYDPLGRVLFRGDGSRVSASGLSDVIATLSAGAADSLGLVPSGMALGPDGSIYVSSYGTHQVWRRHPDGRFTVFAGNGAYGCGGDGGPAAGASLAAPDGVAIGPDGSVYIEDAGNARIRRVAPDGTISTFAGRGQCDTPLPPDPGILAAPPAPGSGPRLAKPEPGPGGALPAGVYAAPAPELGDGGPADSAYLSIPYAVTVAPDGSVYIGDAGQNRVRKVTPDGIITTVAGTGEYGFSGDGGAAADARLASPWGVTVGPDGSLYISDTYNHRVRRVTPDGIITTIAGTGVAGFSGDGGPAIAAQLDRPADRVGFGPDGSVYIPDSDNYRVRRVAPDGTITTVAGNGEFCGFQSDACGDGGPATQGRLAYMYDVMVGPDGDLYIADTGSGRIRRVASVVPGFTAQAIVIASEDGGELYDFDAAGRHLRTRHALTGATLLAFGYDAAGRLATVTDGDGLVTRVERGADGAPAAVVGPFGQRTALAADANGFLARIENAAGEAVRFSSTADGLLTSMTDPRGGVYTFAWDDRGRLTRDEDPRGGFQTLARSATADGYAVRRTTAEGRSTLYRVSTLPGDDRERGTTGPDGHETRTVRGTDESRTTTLPDGGAIRQSLSADPRFGMQAPILGGARVSTPGGVWLEASATREVTLAPDGALRTRTDRAVVGGRTTVTEYDAATRTFTRTTPEGRRTVSRIDALGRVVEMTAPGVAPVTYTYDAQGLLAEVRQGTRAWSYTYQDGYLATRRDPAGRVERYDVDAVGRLRTQTLADGSEIRYGYDANGELVSLAPPGREPHRIDRDAAGRVERVAAPPVGGDSAAVRYGYDLDGALVRITRPGEATVELAYDTAGRAERITLPTGALGYAYDPASGRLASISAPEATIAFAYDGALPLSATWSGTVSGSVGWSYDNTFLVSAERVNGGHEVQYRYDQDGLLTGAGALGLVRDAESGRLSGTTLGGLATGLEYDAYGDPTAISASVGGSPLLRTEYTRDALGRIARLSETLEGATVVWDYRYDERGRLVEVARGGAPFAAYEYDANG
ncbi:MAG TPA: carboxypeptidase regulatory-like domain-containing protein, partial [Longimicrobium sp.]|nr:carboxypeptidase regulatory-like domain-containing protein [Longimicrobium sp.]